MKIALVHDYLAQDGGAEKVLEAMQEVFPKAPTFALFFDIKRFPHLRGKDVRASFLQKIPWIRKRYQWLFPLMPYAMESLDLSGYDVVISNTSAFAKGIVTRHDALHICYCHTPTRYLWSDTHAYVQELKLPKLAKAFISWFLSYIRVWDVMASNRVDIFLANSKTVQARIAKYYRRTSTVLYPPVDTHKFFISPEPKTYFLTGGRLVSYKRFDIAIEAANRIGIRLKIFGTGPMEAELRKMAGKNVEFLGRVSWEKQAELYAGAMAFLHPQEEDFGITAIESMASGRPVIAFKKGGAQETIIEGVTGEFLTEQSWEHLAERLLRFDENRYDPIQIKSYAETYARQKFQEGLARIVESSWSEFSGPAA